MVRYLGAIPVVPRDVVVVSVGAKAFTLLVLDWQVTKMVYVDQHGADGYTHTHTHTHTRTHTLTHTHTLAHPCTCACLRVPV